MTAGQLTLGVKLRDDAQFANFHGDRNASAAARVRAAVEQQGSVQSIIVCGDEDTGKSHLLLAASHKAERSSRSAAYISMKELLPFGPQALEGLEMNQLVCLDDLQVVSGHEIWEEAVFHLYNRVTDAGGQMLISLPEPPSQLPFRLPDLMSRLCQGLLIQLGINRDDDCMRILKARAEKRGLVMNDDVSAFIIKRSSRRLAALLAVLDQLDDNSLRAQRRLTIPFVKSVMGW